MTGVSRIVVSAILFIAVFAQPGLALAGFGVTPPGVYEDRLVPGSSVSRRIFLVQGNPDVDVGIEVTIESRDIKDWITIEQGDSFTISAGVQQYPLGINIKVPEDAELGEYKAFVRVKTKPALATEGGTVSVALGGRIDVELTVGDDVIVEFRIKAIDILDIKERESLQASVTIDNTGNVAVAPDSASFELFDKFGNIRLAFARAEGDQFPKVPAFTQESIVLEFPVDTVLAVGEYWGHVKVYDEKGQVVRELRTVFNVLERTLFDILFSTTSLIIIAGLVLIIVLGVVFGLKRLRKRTPKQQTAGEGGDQSE